MHKHHAFSIFFVLNCAVFSLKADDKGLGQQASEFVTDFAKNVADTLKNGKTDLLDPMGHYPMESEVSLGVVEAVNGAAQAIVTELNYVANLEATQTLTPPFIVVQPWYSKAWNAEIAGYQGAGKYVIVGTFATATALVTAYYLGYFDKAVSIEQMVDDLIAQAQENPNVVIVELPKILASCKDASVQKYIAMHVLANVEMTPEIKEAFAL